VDDVQPVSIPLLCNVDDGSVDCIQDHSLAAFGYVDLRVAAAVEH
jgi:hypothetical protein